MRTTLFTMGLTAVSISNASAFEPLVDPHPSTGARFGQAVEAEAGLVYVGAPGTEGATEHGRVEVFGFLGGVWKRTLEAPAPQPGDRFGASIDGEAGLVLVGAPGRDVKGVAGNGAAYLLDPSTGEVVIEYAASVIEEGAQFGWAVALAASEGVAVVSAPGADGNRGRVYFFDLLTGASLGSFANPVARANGARFGFAMTARDGVLAVTTLGFDTAALVETGAAYVFDIGTRALVARLTPPSRTPGGFGVAIALSDAWVAVGALLESTGAPLAGAVYVFDPVSGKPLRTIANPSPTAGALFGVGLAADDTHVYVGAPSADSVDCFGCGAVYAVHAATGVVSHQVMGFMPGGLFGAAVAVNGPATYAGSPAADTLSPMGGVVLAPALVHEGNACPAVAGDLNRSGRVSIADLHCAHLTLMWSLGNPHLPPPGCLQAAPSCFDVDCDATLTVADLTLVNGWATRQPLPGPLDANGDGIVDSCQAGPATLSSF